MKKTLKILCLFFVLMVVTFGQVFLVSAEETVIHEVSEAQIQAASTYWTPQRMKNAIPAMPALEGSPQEQDATALEEPLGEPGGMTSSVDGTSSVLLTGDDAALMTLAGGIDPMADGYDTYPPPENTYPIPTSWYGSFPIKAIGKVYFTKHDGKNYVCSGSAIGGRGVLTAGHCLSDGSGHFHTNWIFRPAWRDPWAPYGTWTSYTMIVFTSWHNSGNWCRDVGAAKVSDVSGKTLSGTVGHLGYTYNQSRLQHWSLHGYPSAYPWSGPIQVKTGASFSRSDSPDCPSGPNTIGVGTRLTPGASGGPWIQKYRPQQIGANNYANGVNSYYYSSSPLRMYSPYFDTTVKTEIIDWATAL